MLHTRIDPNVEVITCLLNLTERGSQEWNAGIPSQPFRREVIQHFAHLREHPAVLLANRLHAQGFWWDAMIQLALTSTAFPDAVLTIPLPNQRYAAAGNDDLAAGKETLEELLHQINDFCLQADFDEFYRQKQLFYDRVMHEVEAGMPDASWLELVAGYYGAGSDEDARDFYLIPSPLSIGGQGFGAYTHRDDELEIFSVFAPFCSVDSDGTSCGFDEPGKLAELSVHEFGHSFVNHLLEPPHYEHTTAAFAELYAAERATGQMGDAPWAILAEHIIRACEVRIALIAGQPEDAARLLQYNIEYNDYRHLPAVVEAMEDYEHNRLQYPSLAAFIPELMRHLDSIATIRNN